MYSGFTSSLFLGRVGEGGYDLVLVCFHHAETKILNIVVCAWRRKERKYFLICFHLLRQSGWFFSSDVRGVTRREQDNKEPISCYVARQAQHSVWVVQPKVMAGVLTFLYMKSWGERTNSDQVLYHWNVPASKSALGSLMAIHSTFLQRFLQNVT